MQQQGFGRTIQNLGDRLLQGAFRQGGAGAFPSARLEAAGNFEKGAGVEVIAQQALAAALAACRGAVVAADGLGSDPAPHQSAAVLGGFGNVGAGGFEALAAPLAGGGAKAGLQGLAVAGPELLEVVPRLAPQGLELGRQGGVGPQRCRQGIQA